MYLLRPSPQIIFSITARSHHHTLTIVDTHAIKSVTVIFYVIPGGTTLRTRCLLFFLVSLIDSVKRCLVRRGGAGGGGGLLMVVAHG